MKVLQWRENNSIIYKCEWSFQANCEFEKIFHETYEASIKTAKVRKVIAFNALLLLKKYRYKAKDTHLILPMIICTILLK